MPRLHRHQQGILHADAKRKVYIKLPDEDYEEGMCGLLKKSLYGTRDAAQNWGESCTEFMETQGFAKGKASPCCFYEPKRKLRCVVHGDDFTILGDRKHLDWFRERMKKRYPVKIRGRLGPRDTDEKQIRILNRILTWGNTGIEYEDDQRHAEIVIRELGLKDDSREVSSPAEKRIGEHEPRKLEGAEATKYRAMVARMNYLSQDRTDIANTVKELSKDMSSPDTDSMARIKRLGRYLKGKPR